MSTSQLTVAEVVRRTTTYFAEAGSPSPRLDADLVVSHALGMTRLELYTEFDRPLSADELAGARALVARRGRREPMAYILGSSAFRRLELEVTPAVLVPRPETEVLVEWVKEIAAPQARILDWGTGSGAIALALKDERPDCEITAVDISADALAVAQANAARLGLEVSFHQGDGCDGCGEASIDVIAANPPYLSEDELITAPKELSYEPRGALVGGPRGDEVITALAGQAARVLVPGGMLVCEIGGTQAEAVSRIFTTAGLVNVQVREDLAGIARVVAAQRRSLSG